MGVQERNGVRQQVLKREYLRTQDSVVAGAAGVHAPTLAGPPLASASASSPLCDAV